ncbi:hypothetical protein PCL_11469 [Purpureocillium lilacinum]|uniref:Uncharacterized protein n=1 Tax=Purpureocillium lilacinum TaxID=33203 RepID=A0A2U3EA60_PURLI|nr:hypothetical protein PCL_11469 [Purpureocillium lilacinum]
MVVEEGERGGGAAAARGEPEHRGRANERLTRRDPVGAMDGWMDGWMMAGWLPHSVCLPQLDSQIGWLDERRELITEAAGMILHEEQCPTACLFPAMACVVGEAIAEARRGWPPRYFTAARACPLARSLPLERRQTKGGDDAYPATKLVAPECSSSGADDMVGRDVVGVSTGGGDAETRRPCSGMTPVYAMLGATVHRAVGVPFSFVVMHRSFGCICGRRSATTTTTATTATERSPRPVPDRWSDKKGRDWGDLTWEKLCCRYCGHLLRAFVACAVDSQQARRETRNHQNSPPGGLDIVSAHAFPTSLGSWSPRRCRRLTPQAGFCKALRLSARDVMAPEMQEARRAAMAAKDLYAEEGRECVLCPLPRLLEARMEALGPTSLVEALQTQPRWGSFSGARALILATATLPLRNPQSGSARLAGSLPPPGTTLVSGTGRPVVAPLPDSTPV